MRSDVVALLACPICEEALHAGAASLGCSAGHRFDVARQGYVNLLAGRRVATAGDDAAMVAARLAFLQAGHFEPLVHAVADRVAAVDASGAVVDSGCGPGYYLSAVLPPGRPGLGLDVSVPAVRRAARAHPRVSAAVADCWARLPVRDEVAAVVLDIFAPRNGAEFARILRPDGRLIVVTPAVEHLGELIEPLGLVRVDAAKQRRLEESLSGHFRKEDQGRIDFELSLDGAAAGELVRMGPSARHVAAGELDRRLAAQPLWRATACVDIGVYRPSR